MTYRDRRLARAERLRGWADKRAADAARQLTSQPDLRHDWAFITQPGHIPERARMNAADDRAFRSLDKANSMTSRAASIEEAADNAIYDDDPDALERLRAKLAGLEAKRDERKAANVAYRKAHRAELAAMSPYERSEAIPWPSYSLSNLGGNISRVKARIADLERGPRPTWFHASRRDPDVCYKCDYRLADHTPLKGASAMLMCPSRAVA